jgi:GT2 family glycosyltransferase
MLAIVILQHGRWRDTIACLQSLVRAVTAGHARVIVVDNASPDDSVSELHRWIRGEHGATPRPVHDTVASNWWPLVGTDAAWDVQSPSPHAPQGSAPWTLLVTDANDGFGAGMNHGVRIALNDPAVDAVWLLNNDTVVGETTVDAIRRAIDGAAASVGQFGMTVCYYDRPTIVQSIGWCRWNAWFATGHRVHDGASVFQPLARVPRQPGYVYGASWILRASALRDVGLLSEEGFLYGEELDWSCRAADRWGTELIADATVWHREGATIGAGAATAAKRSELADLSGISARLRISRRFFPNRLPAVYSSLFGAALNRLRRGDARRAAAVARLVVGGGLPAPRPVPSSDSQSSSSS